jgi:hypothetical protein
MPSLTAQHPVTVHYRDGTSATIALAELTIRQLYQFARHLAGGDSAALVALCAGQPPEWVDTLTDESYLALVAKAHELNFPRALRLAGSDPVLAARLAPLALDFERLSQVAGLAKTHGPSGSASSPTPAPSASPAETGSASST